MMVHPHSYWNYLGWFSSGEKEDSGPSVSEGQSPRTLVRVQQ